MFFRTSFLIAAFACAIAIISQCGTVYAAPGLRPMLHAFDVEPSSAVIDSAVPTPSTDATASPVAVIDDAASSGAAEATTTSSSGDTPQANSAFATFPGLTAAIIISTVAAVSQVV